MRTLAVQASPSAENFTPAPPGRPATLVFGEDEEMEMEPLPMMFATAPTAACDDVIATAAPPPCVPVHNDEPETEQKQALHAGAT